MTSGHPARPIAWLIVIVGILGTAVGGAYTIFNIDKTFFTFNLTQILLLGILWTVVGIALLLTLRGGEPEKTTYRTDATGSVPIPPKRDDAPRFSTEATAAMPSVKPQAADLPSSANPARFDATTIKVMPPAPMPNAPTLKIDDLAKLEGVGPKVKEALNNAGVFTFAQLASMSADDILRIVKDAGVRIVGDPGTWPKQAKLLADGDLQGFQSYVKSLVGGREPNN
jgi:predicted flap endonuclease-1-like 5' DNA nuclease